MIQRRGQGAAESCSWKVEMKEVRKDVRVAMLAALLCVATQSASAATLDEIARQVAPPDGWAAQDGGTHGGSEADPSRIYTVSTPDDFRDAVQGFRARIVYVKGRIDFAQDRPFASTADQKIRGVVNIGSRTTIIGLGKDAHIVNANLMLDKVSQVIIRNLTIENPCDVGPTFDGGDGPTGNWNSEFDGITLKEASHAWVDHVTFTDGATTDDKLPFVNGHVKQCHDGALDVTHQSDYITVSNSIFMLHDKNDLIGHSDTARADTGTLKVSFHDNWFQDITQRTPRVRYGQVHVFNNLYTGSLDHPAYPYLYSIGAGYDSRIISENNDFEIPGVNRCDKVIRNFGGKTLVEQGSLLNGQTLDMKDCSYDPEVGWKPPYAYTLKPAAEVAASVRAQAGAGKLETGAP